MTVNWQECYKLWREFEGLELTAYPDPATDNEPWTIGYGHTGLISGAKVKRGLKITKEQAEQFMVNDLNVVYNKLKSLVKVHLNPNQWAALISFSGNVKWTSVLKSSVLSYINQNRLAEVPGRMALYRLGNGKVMNGLVRRRAAEGNLWMKPIADTTHATNQEIREEIKEAKGVDVDAAKTKKPWDWGAIGAFATLIAGLSNDVKTSVGNFTTAFGIDPVSILIVVGLGFAAWTIYSKWKER